jgi:hypothetical protein
MKRMIMAVTALFMMATAAMAQDNNNNKEQSGKKFDKTEMIQKRTDKMVEQYGLNSDQAKSLLALNQEYADKMPMMGGGRPGGHGPGMKKSDNSSDTQQGENAEKQRPSEEQMKARMQEMKANMEAYDAKLKTIMSDSQYAKYQEDMKQRMQRGPRGGQRSNDTKDSNENN